MKRTTGLDAKHARHDLVDDRLVTLSVEVGGATRRSELHALDLQTRKEKDRIRATDTLTRQCVFAISLRATIS